MKVERQPWFLRHWRKHRGETQESLACALGLSKPYISQLERGERQYNQDILEKLARHLGCRPADLLTGAPTDAKPARSLFLVRGDLISGHSAKERYHA